MLDKLVQCYFVIVDNYITVLTIMYNFSIDGKDSNLFSSTLKHMYFKYLHSERHYNIGLHAQSEHCMTKVTACTHVHLKSKATQKLHNMSKKSVFRLNFLLFGALRQCCILSRSKIINYFNRILCQGSVKYWSIIWCINTSFQKSPKRPFSYQVAQI